MLLALGAAGVTLMVVLAVIGVPAVDRCAGDPRGVVNCLRDMTERKFDLPDSVPDSVPATPTAALTPEPIPNAVAVPASATPVAVPPAEPKPVAVLPPPPSSPDLQPTQTVAVPPPPAPAPPARDSVPEVMDAVAPDAPPAPVNAWTIEPPLPALIADTSPPEPLPSAATTITPTAPAERDLSPAEPPAIAPPAPQAAAIEPAKATPDVTRSWGVPVPSAKAPPLAAAPAQTNSELELAAAEPVEPPSQPAITVPLVLAPTIDAIELDGAASYISGSGPAGAVMRLYADGQLVGESPVEDGRWLVESDNLLDVPRRELRIEAIEPETGKRLGEATITVEIEQPAQPATPQPKPTETPDLGGMPATPTAPVARPETPSVAAATPPAESLAEAPTDQPPQPLPQVDAYTPRGETDSVEILGSSDFTPDSLPPIGDIDHEAATIVLAPPDAPALIAEFTLQPPEPSGDPVTLLQLLPFGDPDSSRYNTGKIVIRHGDTLWSVARRYYGHGIHFRTILNANDDKIRRASRIFPGQVFDLPLMTDE